ncbi:hypothetical protein [Saccharicrinis fermentans]|uniref:Uncharacterized protein n=1 Tax=Saccharicrinis fermentans DSM 9555 = JCM 21142 TaxID=869213 RepID=W7Y5G7_9BACT|nr:hypothetical protein [Saccharicrinis fermentans]GAF02808.1 hypothetical protein JCM21142_41453 [Saccharicrinis fermentans DSM 9555 = JCM 21142]
MPYRRLPNTDQARLRALKAALEKGRQNYPYDLAYSQQLYLDIQGVLPQFEQIVSQYNFSKERQAKYGKLLADQFKEARIYVSHFIQVLNFCIIRKELKPEVRKMFGLDVDDKSVPDLSTEQLLLHWGKKVVEGEERRMMTGGTRIYNPSIALVKVKFEKFVEYFNNHKNLLQTTQKMHEKVVDMRDRIDHLIVKIWNGVEECYKDLPGDQRRSKCAHYGVVYMFRKDEKSTSL